LKTTIAHKELDKTLAAIRKKIAAVNALRKEAHDELDAVIATAERMKAELGLNTATVPRGKVFMTKPRRNFSPEAIENISKAATKRWKEYRKSKKAKTVKNKAPKKTATRKFSAKGRLAVSEGMRKYWARRKKTAAAAQKDNLVQMPRTGTNG